MRLKKKLKVFMAKRKRLKEVQNEWKKAETVLSMRNMHRNITLDEYLEALLLKFEMLDLMNDNETVLRDINKCYITNPKMYDILENLSPHSLTKEECSVLTAQLKQLKALTTLRFQHYYIQGAADFIVKPETPYFDFFIKLNRELKEMDEAMKD